MGITYKRGIDVNEGSSQSTLADFLVMMDVFSSLRLSSLFLQPELEKERNISLYQGGLLRAVNKEGYFPASEKVTFQDREDIPMVFYLGGLEYQFLRELYHTENSKDTEKSKSIPQIFRYWVQERQNIPESLLSHPSLERLEKNIENLTPLGIVRKENSSDLFAKYRLQDIRNFWVKNVPAFLE